MSKPKLSPERRKIANEVIVMFKDGNPNAAIATRKYIDGLPHEQQAMLVGLMILGRRDTNDKPEHLEDLIKEYDGEDHGEYLADKPLGNYLRDALSQFA